MPEFREWPKIARLNRDMVVTEKIDGTNACVIITEVSHQHMLDIDTELGVVQVGQGQGVARYYTVAAQSRSRIITPAMDNHGFARWVEENAIMLVADLGEGYHFGEWAGGGIGKRYPREPKQLWLFNTSRWYGRDFTTEGLGVVPVLYEGLFNTTAVNACADQLRENGSVAYLGCRAEGVVAYHRAANLMFKATLEKDDEWKDVQA